MTLDGTTQPQMAGVPVLHPPFRVELSLESSTAPLPSFYHSSSSHLIFPSPTISYHRRTSRDDIDSSLNTAPLSHHSPNTLRQELLHSSYHLIQWQTRRSRKAIMVSHASQLDRRHILEVLDALATMAPPQCSQASSCRNRVRAPGCPGSLSHPVSLLSQHDMVTPLNARTVANASSRI